MNLTGRVFDRLTVIKRVEDIVYPNGRKVPQWLCECSCDEKTNIIVCQDSLLNKRCRSCGCLKRETTSKRFKKYNTYNLSGEYGVDYTQKEEEFYFDLEDYDKIKDYCWCINQDGYVFNSGSRIFMHRLVTDCPQNMFVDHRHGEESRNDNRKTNLRICTVQENNRNHKICERNTSGVTGVSFDKTRNKWEASIKFNNKNYKKRFDSFDDAVTQRKKWEDEFFGEYSYYNSQKTNREE